MNVLLLFIDVLKDVLRYTLPLMLVWLLVRPYVGRMIDTKLVDIRRENVKITLPLRLQAYERAVLFLERLNPVNMLLRIHMAEMTAAHMQQQMLAEIRAEFQHNVAQQLYMSNQAWSIMKKMVDDTVALVNNTAASLPADSSALLLSKAILVHLESLEIENPYEASLKLIKRDIQQLF